MMRTIFDFLKNVLYIIEGYCCWASNILTGKTREIAKKRLEICNECTHNDNGICDLCGCIIKAKVRVDFPLDENGISIDGCVQKKW